jgi:hypothetical protein
VYQSVDVDDELWCNILVYKPLSGAQMRSLVVLGFFFVPAGGLKTRVLLLFKKTRVWVFICLADWARKRNLGFVIL